MLINAKMKVKRLEISLEGKGSVVAEVSFIVGNMPEHPSNRTRVSVPITDELIRYCQEIVAKQVGDIILKENDANE